MASKVCDQIFTWPSDQPRHATIASSYPVESNSPPVRNDRARSNQTQKCSLGFAKESAKRQSNDQNSGQTLSGNSTLPLVSLVAPTPRLTPRSECYLRKVLAPFAERVSLSVKERRLGTTLYRFPILKRSPTEPGRANRCCFASIGTFYPIRQKLGGNRPNSLGFVPK